MFGVALGMDLADFRQIRRAPRAVVAGAIAQFAFLPAFTFLLLFLTQPHPAIALGMVLVAACPGGNISNFISSLSRADVALSVSLTAIATLLSPVFTPLNFTFWSDLLPGIGTFRRQFELSFVDMIRTVTLLLVLPLILGLLFKRRFAKLTETIEKPVKILSILILVGFILVALVNNFEAFKKYLVLAFGLVAVHNAIAFGVGYATGRLSRLDTAMTRTLTIETGIQNSALALIVIFNFFGGNGGMALIAAWWGIWHIVAGLVVAGVMRRTDAIRAET